MAEVHASDHITRKSDAGDDPRPSCLIRHAIDRRGLIWEEISEHLGGCCRRDGVFRRIRWAG
jgi:hypothetical protein